MSSANNKVDMEPLLSGLTIGASEPMYSIEDWAARLENIPEGDVFVEQLRHEWLPAAPPDDFCARMITVCCEHLASWHSGWPNLWAHILRVAGYALLLAPESGMDADEAYLLALIHDVGKFDEMRGLGDHEALAAVFARRELSARYPLDTVEAIAQAVGKELRLSSAHANLLYDADKLDKIGATAIIRRVSQVLTLPNALGSLRRIEGDLAAFPKMKHANAQRLAAMKADYTTDFLKKVRSRPELAL